MTDQRDHVARRAAPEGRTVAAGAASRPAPVRVLAIGECMVELTHQDLSTLRLGFAGDTFNTALYLARVTSPERLEVDYATMVGDDRYSQRMLQAMRDEGIGTDLVRCLPGRRVGLYLVHTDNGERTFTYYRSDSAARELFGPHCSTELDQAVVCYDAVYLSAITLQILPSTARARLFDVLAEARGRGVDVVFDSNYRPAAWPDTATAREVIAAACRLSTLVLPTFDDECALFQDPDPAATIGRLVGLGVPEIVVKDGARGCVVWDGSASHEVPTTPVVPVVDTTAAGDSFNAAYLSARLMGASPVDAARDANVLAGTVIRHPGAVVPASVLPPRRPRHRPPTLDASDHLEEASR